MLRNVKALYEVALDELWALFTHFVMSGGRDENPHQVRPVVPDDSVREE